MTYDLITPRVQAAGTSTRALLAGDAVAGPLFIAEQAASGLRHSDEPTGRSSVEQEPSGMPPHRSRADAVRGRRPGYAVTVRRG